MEMDRIFLLGINDKLCMGLDQYLQNYPARDKAVNKLLEQWGKDNCTQRKGFERYFQHNFTPKMFFMSK